MERTMLSRREVLKVSAGGDGRRPTGRLCCADGAGGRRRGDAQRATGRRDVGTAV